MASELGYLEVAQLLINAGADIEAKDNEGTTALMVASGMGHIHIIYR